MISLQSLEAILFVAGSDGVTVSELTTVFECPADEAQQQLTELVDMLSVTERPYVVSFDGKRARLVTRPEHSDILSKTRYVLESAPLSKSQLEVASLLAYRGPSTKVDIDTVRGVNSVQPVKTLLARGIIERKGESHGSTVYALTQGFWDMLGVVQSSYLPEYTDINNHLKEQL
jgi:segregation and condensation protein B